MAWNVLISVNSNWRLHPSSTSGIQAVVNAQAEASGTEVKTDPKRILILLWADGEDKWLLFSGNMGALRIMFPFYCFTEQNVYFKLKLVK